LTRIYATAEIPAVGREEFGPIGPIQVLRDGWSDLDQAEVLIVRAQVLDAQAIERATSLQLIARSGSGVDNVDIEAASARGIQVISAPTAGALTVAEGTITLMLAAMKRLGQLGDVVRDGRWQDRLNVEVLDIQSSRLGIVGFGRIGQEVARLATALGMEVVAYDPLMSGSESMDRYELLSLPSLLESSDVISLHCPLTDETRGLIDRTMIEKIKPQAVLVNVARGEIIADDGLLVDALNEGRLSAVAIDVFGEEPPPPGNPLLSDHRVICSPHSIGLTREWNRLVFGSLAADIGRFLAGERPVHLVNGDVLDSRLPG
jgi:phosphoglycerate dehydrogenase-like enzyme